MNFPPKYFRCFLSNYQNFRNLKTCRSLFRHFQDILQRVKMDSTKAFSKIYPQYEEKELENVHISKKLKADTKLEILKPRKPDIPLASNSNMDYNEKRLPKKRPFTVSIEGNIGSGKSTLLDYFSSTSGVSVYQEPIDKWTNLGGYNLLQKLYENPSRWGFLFQSYVQLTRLDLILRESDSDVKLIERSIQNNRFCFLENSLSSGDISKEEYDVICEYFEVFDKRFDISIDLIVYLRTSPEVVYERIKTRGRSEESSISLDYLKRVHEMHESWLREGDRRGVSSAARVITIDADKGVDHVIRDVEKLKHLILGQAKDEAVS